MAESTEITWKLYSPLTAFFYPKDDYGDIDIGDVNGVPFKGTDLLVYGDRICKAVGRDFEEDGNLANFIHDDFKEGKGVLLRRKVLSIVPNAENFHGDLMGCATVKLREPLTDEETDALCSFLEDQYENGWGEYFNQRGIMIESGALFVHFWAFEQIVFVIDKQPAVVQEKLAEQTVPQPQRPKMNLVGMDSNIFFILGTASRLLRGAGQAEQAKEMEQRVQNSHDYYKALGIISEYVETELSHAVRANREKPEQKKGGDAR